MHGRRTLAIINALDAVVVSYVVLIIALSLDALHFYDALMLAAHWVHAITVPLGYVIVRHSTAVTETLRLLVMLCITALFFDGAIFVVRLVLLTGFVVHSATAMAPAAGVVRCIVALLFLGVDIFGAFFADFAQQYALMPMRTDTQLIATARALAHQPNSYTEQRHPYYGTRIVSLAMPQPMIMQQQKLLPT